MIVILYFFRLENIKTFIRFLLASCECIGGLAGFEAMEVEWELYKNDVVRFLSDGPPECEGKQPPVAHRRLPNTSS